jgi:hypothetical protein
MHMVADSVGSRSGGGSSKLVNDGLASSLHNSNEFIVDPRISLENFSESFIADLGVIYIRELSV